MQHDANKAKTKMQAIVSNEEKWLSITSSDSEMVGRENESE